MKHPINVIICIVISMKRFNTFFKEWSETWTRFYRGSLMRRVYHNSFGKYCTSIEGPLTFSSLKLVRKERADLWGHGKSVLISFQLCYWTYVVPGEVIMAVEVNLVSSGYGFSTKLKSVDMRTYSMLQFKGWLIVEILAWSATVPEKSNWNFSRWTFHQSAQGYDNVELFLLVPLWTYNTGCTVWPYVLLWSSH